MVELLKRPSLVCINRMGHDQYPKMSRGDYILAELLLLSVQGQSLDSRFRHIFDDLDVNELGIEHFPEAMTLLGRSAIDKIIRKFSFRAGVVNMASSVYDLAWKSLI